MATLCQPGASLTLLSFQIVVCFFLYSRLLFTECLSNIRFGSTFHVENKNKWATQMKDALLAREDCNVVLVDWSKGARFPYERAAGNTRLVGAQTAELIRFLISSSSGSPSLAERFYIVGFSLGAVVAGYAGNNLKKHKIKLGRITGMSLGIFSF